jgi:hypothetical protein
MQENAKKSTAIYPDERHFGCLPALLAEKIPQTYENLPFNRVKYTQKSPQLLKDPLKLPLLSSLALRREQNFFAATPATP